jgi:hypothetical protein
LGAKTRLNLHNKNFMNSRILLQSAVTLAAVVAMIENPFRAAAADVDKPQY